MINFQNFKKELKSLPLIGKGTSRKVYDLGNGTVAKVATNVKGIAQNKQETEIYEEDSSDYYSLKLFAIVYDHNENYSIIIAEKCIKIKSIKQLKILLDDTDGEETEIHYENTIEELFHRFQLGKRDLKRPSSWGLNSKNEPVLIDYGLTGQVWEEHYYRVKKYTIHY